MDSNEVASKARSRLATPELSKWIEKIKIYMLDNPGFEPEATLHLRLTGAEREMLRAAAADGDGHSPPLDTGWPKDEVREVGILLFFRWYVKPPILNPCRQSMSLGLCRRGYLGVLYWGAGEAFYWLHSTGFRLKRRV